MIIDLADLNFDLCAIEFDRSQLEYPHGYIEEREKVWQQEKAVCGNNLWNGTVYTIKRFALLLPHQVIFSLGICQYKDLIFKRIYGGDNIIKKYGRKFLVYHTAVLIIPVTTDGKYVFGVVAKNGFFAAGKIVLLGGALNYDEGKINSFADIRAFAAKELAEETRLNINPERLKLASLNSYKFTYHFVFFLILDIASTELNKISKIGELSNLVAFSQSELAELSSHPASDYVRFYGNYLQYFGDRFKNKFEKNS